MRYPSPPSSTSTTEASTIGSILSKNARVCRALLAEIPSPADVQAMLEITGVWWATWRGMSQLTTVEECNDGNVRAGMFPGVSDDPKPLPQYVSWGLSQDCPARVALAVTCIAVSVSKLKPGVDDLSLNLRGPPNELVDRYLAVVDQLVLHDDDYLATLDGVELLALQAKCHNNLGQPRKGWLLFRKAISYAQLLGLHTDRPTILGRMQISVDRRRNVWSSLCSVDRYLSLLLGLPYAVSENLCLSRQTAKPDSMSTELYREKLSVIAGRVIDRNQASTSPSFSATLEIDQKLDDLAGSMADDWWDLGSAKVPEMVSIEEFNHRLGAQFWHHQIKAALHLPFMLRSAADRRFEYSRTACFDASREVLQRYHVLRMDDNAVYFMCRVIDFQGFLAAVGLLLGLLGYGRSSSADHSVYRDQDLNLIRTTLDTFRRVSLEPNGTVATQCLHVLETLSATRDHGLEPETRYRLVVPYFGTITITPGSMYSHPSDVASVPNLNSPAHLFSSTVSMYSRSRQHENVPVGSSFIDAKALGSRPRNGVLSRSTSSMANINIEWQGSTDMDIGQEWNHLDDVHV